MKKKSHKLQAKVAEIRLAIQSLLSESNYTPLTAQELFHRLSLAPFNKHFFDKALTQLSQENKILIKEDLIYPKEELVVQGTFKAHARGFGFVITGTTPDIFIPPEEVCGAIDSDVVKVEIHYPISPKGIDGKIIGILERKRKTAIATVLSVISKGHKYFIHVPLFGKNAEQVLDSSEKLSIGDRLLVNFEQTKDKTYFSLIQNIANIRDASKDIYVSALENELPQEFPHEVLHDVEKYADHVTGHDKKTRKDLTSFCTVTIDPTRAKDFDDAISLSKDKTGYHLGVHIADVAHYVKISSALDKEAYKRANSTYFPGFVIPMLPHELSSHLCSLKPDVERLTITVFMDFDVSGEMTHYDIVRSVIKSQKRFTYEEALAVIDQKVKSPFFPLLSLMKELALLLKAKRHERGSFDFTVPEAEVVVDDFGNPQEILLHEYDITHQMIEEFMLKANETIAKHLFDQKKMVLYRIHEAPTKESMQAFFALARAIGFPMPAHPSHDDIQKLFEKAKTTPMADRLSIHFIRSMRLAYYSADNVGHYGLALEHYCHFTSPIRRYSDLVAQRLLFDEAKDIDIVEIASHVSDRERLSMKAEMAVILLKKLRLLHKAHKKDPGRPYEAIITSVKPFGIVFEVKDFYVEGFIHVSQFWDFFRFDEQHLRLIGDSTRQVFAVGSTIKVYLEKVDLISLDTQWEIDQK